MTTDDFSRGYLLAVANIMHLHGKDTIARDVLSDGGISKATMERMGFDTFDLKPLRRLYADMAAHRRADRQLATRKAAS